ncbi:hypothetical protein, partial [Pseudoflavonifractor phocaeensis]|uniref:hypothetical protein n=1 Tax=Pseudoflavonifractor phocaeensis TaxID=1870988 RepID=UPI00195BBE26
EPEAVDMEHEMTPVSVFFSAQIPIADFQRPLCQQLQIVPRLVLALLRQPAYPIRTVMYFSSCEVLRQVHFSEKT